MIQIYSTFPQSPLYLSSASIGYAVLFSASTRKFFVNRSSNNSDVVIFLYIRNFHGLFSTLDIYIAFFSNKWSRNALYDSELFPLSLIVTLSHVVEHLTCWIICASWELLGLNFAERMLRFKDIKLQGQ